MERDFVALRDLGSRNGTLLNGKRIAQDAFLADGDTIIVGDAIFKVKISQDERASTHAAIVEIADGAAAQPAPTEEKAEEKPQPEPPQPQIVEEPAAQPHPPAGEVPAQAEPAPHKAEPPRHAIAFAVPSAQPFAPMTEEIITAESKPAPAGFETGLYERVVEGLIAASESFSGHYERNSYKARNIMAILTRVLGIGEDERRNLLLAAMLYEVGKYYIATEVLNKGEALTAAEKEHIQKHPQLAVRIFEKAPLPEGVIDAIAHHHERWDGTGYPDGMKGEEIPAGARMLAMADTLAAITSSRPYRPAMSTPQALDELEKNAGTQFDPAMTAKFVDYCRLHSGELRDAVNPK
jgi:hypothetical protein